MGAPGQAQRVDMSQECKSVATSVQADQHDCLDSSKAACREGLEEYLTSGALSKLLIAESQPGLEGTKETEPELEGAKETCRNRLEECLASGSLADLLVPQSTAGELTAMKHACL